MNSTKFNRTILVIAVAIMIAIGVIGFIGEKLPPRLINIQIVGGNQAAEFVNQQIELQFSRPMNWTEFKDKLTISPTADYQIYWNVSTLFIVFSQPLNPDQEYKITISSQATDNYHDKLEQEINLNFRTKQRRLAFISKEGSQNKVLLASDKLEVKQELFAADKIRLFKISGNYLAIVTETRAGGNELIIKDLQSGAQTTLESGSVRVSGLDISKPAQQILYIVQPVDLADGIAIPTSGSIMKLAALANPEPVELKPPFEVKDVMDVRFSDDGLGAVFRDENGSYVLMDINNPAANVALGRHISMSNFSRDGSKIIMLDQPIGNQIANYPVVSSIDSNRNLEKLFDGSEFIIDPRFLNQSNRVVYSKLDRQLSGSKGVFVIMLLDLDTKKSKPLFAHPAKQSLELPKPSPDDALLVIERYTDQDQQNYEDLRSMEFQAKPANANLVILNLKTEEVIDNGIRGVDAMWLE
jgi:dipeptidyl aminopeptidase/acylaminoacyl peptidase